MGKGKKVTKSRYAQSEVEACVSVLIELINLLNEFKDSIVLVGGWVPALIYPDAKPKHIRSLDIDLVFDHLTIDNETYKSLENVLFENGYIADEGKTFSYYKEVLKSDGKLHKVFVDILSGAQGGTGRKHRHQKIQNIKARKLQGAELALECFETVRIKGVLPTGQNDSVRLKVAGVVPFIIMKGLALGRMNEKDSYDIWFCLSNHPDGLDDLIKRFHPFISTKVVREGLTAISDKFETISHIGPEHVAGFLEATDDSESERIKRDAFERVDYLLKGLGIR